MIERIAHYMHLNGIKLKWTPSDNIADFLNEDVKCMNISSALLNRFCEIGSSNLLVLDTNKQADISSFLTLLHSLTGLSKDDDAVQPASYLQRPVESFNEELSEVISKALSSVRFSVFSPQLVNAKCEINHLGHHLDLEKQAALKSFDHKGMTSFATEAHSTESLAYTGTAGDLKGARFLMSKFIDENTGKTHSVFDMLATKNALFKNALLAQGVASDTISVWQQKSSELITNAITEGMDKPLERTLKTVLIPIDRSRQNYVSVTPVVHNMILSTYASAIQEVRYNKSSFEKGIEPKSHLYLDDRHVATGNDVQNAGQISLMIGGRMPVIQGLAPNYEEGRQSQLEAKIYQYKTITKAYDYPTIKSLLNSIIVLSQTDYQNKRMRDAIDFHVKNFVQCLLEPMYKIQERALSQPEEDFWSSTSSPFYLLPDHEKHWLDPRLISDIDATKKAMSDAFVLQIRRIGESFNCDSNTIATIESTLLKEF